MVYLLKMVIFHGYVSHNQMVNPQFLMVLPKRLSAGICGTDSGGSPFAANVWRAQGLACFQFPSGVILQGITYWC